MPKIVAILQARMSSSRLPGKVLRPILKQPMLAHQIARINRSKYIDELVVATSNEQSDQAIVTFCKTSNIKCFQGSLPDVLDRFYQAAKEYKAHIVVRLTGDCPLNDAEIIDRAIEEHKANDNDYTTNSILSDDPNNKFTFADGLDVEVINFETLTKLWSDTSENFYREHVTSYVRLHSSEFNVGYFHHTPDISMFRLTVDEPEDFTVVTEVFKNFADLGSLFSYRDAIEFLKANPKLSQLNKPHNIFSEE